jgi:hypothetical protein
MKAWQGLAEQRRMNGAYRAVFDNEEGKLVLADLARLCRENSTAVEAPSPLDPLVLAREEGKRAIWLHIKGMLALDRGEIERALRGRQAMILHEISSVVEEARTA